MYLTDLQMQTPLKNLCGMTAPHVAIFLLVVLLKMGADVLERLDMGCLQLFTQP